MNDNKKICLITGATSGIGYVTARELTRRGMRVSIVGRNPEKTQAKADQIKNETGFAPEATFIADLSEMNEVRRLAGQVSDRFDRIDVLVNNAGAVFSTRQETSDGFERTLALNYLSPFLLTNLLIDPLMAASAARVINVSSIAHRMFRLNLDDLQNKHFYAGWIAYARSKLANVYFTYELARKFKGSRATCNALHPGYVASGFGTQNNGFWGWFFKLLTKFEISAEEGALTSIYLADSPEVEGISGAYFSACKRVKSSRVSYDEAIAGRLWQMSAGLTGLNVSNGN